MDSIQCNLNVNYEVIKNMRRYKTPMKKNSGEKLSIQAFKKYVSSVTDKPAANYNRWSMQQLLNELVSRRSGNVSSIYAEFHADIFKLGDYNDITINNSEVITTEDGKAYIRIAINNELHLGTYSAGYLYYGTDDHYHIYIPVRGNKICFWDGRFSPVGLRNDEKNRNPNYEAEMEYLSNVYPGNIYIQQTMKNNLSSILHLLEVNEEACLEDFFGTIDLAK